MRLGRRLVVAGGVGWAGVARGACRLQPVGRARLRVVEGFAVLDATVRGVAASFLLDTGAQGHLVTPPAAAALRLPTLPGTVPLIGTGGARSAPIVSLAGVVLGGVALEATASPVASLPPAVPPMAPMVAGLLGAPLFDRFDLLIDAGAGSLELYPAGGCDGLLPALSTRQSAIGLTVLPDRQALLPVGIDGDVITALLDTGSRATLLTEGAARRLGLRAPDSANMARGIDGEAMRVAHTRVRAMAVGEDVRRDVPVSIAPLQLGRAEMLLGFDYLRQRRVWISALTGQLVIGVPPLGP